MPVAIRGKGGDKGRRKPFIENVLQEKQPMTGMGDDPAIDRPVGFYCYFRTAGKTYKMRAFELKE